jgi:hypothetical protein
MVQCAIGIYRRLLRLYPAGFRSEFGSEMQATFTQAILERQARLRWVVFCLRELVDLPGALLRQYWEHWLAWFEGGSMNPINEFTAPSSRRAALMGALPFLAYGLASMLGKLTFDRIHSAIVIWMGLYGFILFGLLIGWGKGFPRWAYPYLGWALVFAWMWSNFSTQGLKIMGYTFPYSVPWGWLLLDGMVLIALAWSRSLRPVKQFFVGIWNDWTRLSFTLFAFLAWILLLYDENHHPYLLWFMLGSTLIISLSAYFYLRAANHLQRLLSLVVGTMAGLTISWICDGTWDFAAYYHLPPSHDPWYMAIFRWSMALAIFALFLLAPAALALLRKGIRRLKA